MNKLYCLVLTGQELDRMRLLPGYVNSSLLKKIEALRVDRNNDKRIEYEKRIGGHGEQVD